MMVEIEIVGRLPSGEAFRHHLKSTEEIEFFVFLAEEIANQKEWERPSSIDAVFDDMARLSRFEREEHA